MLRLTLTWVICGAGRRVGKTHLAQRLCDILPDAVYAKQGCSQPKPDKPPNFFRNNKTLTSFVDAAQPRYKHVVLESNEWARKGRGDIILFVDGIPGRTDYRPDVALLRSRAHVHVGPSGSIRDWKRVLRRKLTSGALCEAACDVLTEHKRFLCRTGPVVRTKVWFVVDGMHAFGSGLARLLEQVDRHGTLRQAARATRMSYRHAWNSVRNAEKHLGKRLIEPHAGGVGGGRTTLSPDGCYLLETFKRLNEEVATFANERFAARPEGQGRPRQPRQGDSARQTAGE